MGKKIFAFSNSTLFVILILILLVGILLTMFKSNKLFENFSTSSNKYTVEYYYMNNCGYCTSFKPEWDNFTEMVDKLGSSASFDYATYNISNTDPDGARANKFSITGTPTVIITDISDNLVATYNGDRTASDLMLFANNNSKVT